MYLWNAERLALALRAGRLTEAEKAKYLIVGTLLGSLSAQPGLVGWRTAGGAARSAAWLVATLGGISLCYLANHRGDGRAFIERFICLLVPVYARWLVLYYGAWMALALVGQAVGRPRLPATAFGAWYPLLMLPLFYALLYQYVAIAARPREDEAGSATTGPAI